MPAIQPVRLKKQAIDLAGKFSQPAVFVRDLHALLEVYTDHTHRSGQGSEPAPLKDSYKVPPPVMREVWNELAPMLKQQPQALLPLCDALWEVPNYDLQLLAARLLAQVQDETPAPVIDHLEAWIQPGVERRLLDKLLENNLLQLQRTFPKSIPPLVSAWLMSTQISLKQAGLRALLIMINISGNVYLPTIFRLLVPFVRIAPNQLRPDILAVLTALAHASPAETAFLLRQNLSAPNNPDTPWLIRQVLGEFPIETQSVLKQAMKSAELIQST